MVFGGGGGGGRKHYSCKYIGCEDNMCIIHR